MGCECENCSLHQSVLFAGLPREQISRLACAFHLGRYKRSQVVFSQDGPTHHIYALQSGLVKLVKQLRNGKDRILRIVFPGELFGLEALTGTTYPLAAITLQDSEICAASPDELFSFLRQDPEIALGMVRLLIAEVGRARSHVTDMSFKDARMKVATFLLTVLPQRNSGRPMPSSVALPFSRQEISEILELSPETISRTLSAFRRERLIDARGRRLTVRDWAALAKAAEH